MKIEFEVFGKPVPQGSKQAQVIYKKGPNGKPIPVTKNGRVVAVTRNDSDQLLSWRGAVSDAARRAYNGPLIAVAASLAVTFYRPRPKGDYGTGRNAGVLKASAPKYPTTKPDTIKLVRAVEDSLSGVCVRDDSQFVEHYLFKRWGEIFCTTVAIETLQ